MRFSEACYGFSQKEQGSNKCCSRLREAQLCYGKGVEEEMEVSKVMVNSRTQQAATSIRLNGHKLEKTDIFNYFDSTLTKDGSSTKEVKTKLSLASLPGSSHGNWLGMATSPVRTPWPRSICKAQ